jgi:phosphatidylglycerophosphatase A
VNRVLTKREVHNAIITGIELDKLAEQKKLDYPLQNILEEDEGLYGIDEIMALSIVNVYVPVIMALCTSRLVNTRFTLWIHNSMSNFSI